MQPRTEDEDPEIVALTKRINTLREKKAREEEERRRQEEEERKAKEMAGGVGAGESGGGEAEGGGGGAGAGSGAEAVSVTRDRGGSHGVRVMPEDGGGLCVAEWGAGPFGSNPCNLCKLFLDRSIPL